MGGISGALSASGLGVASMIALSGTMAAVTSIGDHIIGGSDFSRWETWADIGISTGLGLIFGAIGGAGLTNAKVLDGAVSKSPLFAKAALSYDTVLTKIFSSSYKSLAGAAGARAITLRNLQNVWQSIVTSTIKKNFISGISQSLLSGLIDIAKTFAFKLFG